MEAFRSPRARSVLSQKLYDATNNVATNILRSLTPKNLTSSQALLDKENNQQLANRGSYAIDNTDKLGLKKVESTSSFADPKTELDFEEALLGQVDSLLDNASQLDNDSETKTEKANNWIPHELNDMKIQLEDAQLEIAALKDCITDNVKTIDCLRKEDQLSNSGQSESKSELGQASNRSPVRMTYKERTFLKELQQKKQEIKEVESTNLALKSKINQHEQSLKIFDQKLCQALETASQAKSKADENQEALILAQSEVDTQQMHLDMASKEITQLKKEREQQKQKLQEQTAQIEDIQTLQQIERTRSNQELEVANEQLRQLVSKQQETSRIIKSLEKVIEERSRQVSELRIELAKSRQQVAELENQLNQKEQANLTMGADLAMANMNLINQEKELLTAQSHIKEQEKTISRLMSEAMELRLNHSDLGSTKRALLQADETIKQLEHSLMQAEQALQSSASQDNSDKKELKEQITTLTNQLGTAKQLAEENLERFEMLTKEAASQKVFIADLECELNHARVTIADLQDEKKQLEKKCRTMSKQSDKQKKALEVTGKIEAGLRAQIATLKQTEQEMKKTMEKLSKKLQAKCQNMSLQLGLEQAKTQSQSKLIKSLQNEKTESEKELKETRAQLCSTEIEVGRIQAELASVQTQLKELRYERDHQQQLYLQMHQHFTSELHEQASCLTRIATPLKSCKKNRHNANQLDAYFSRGFKIGSHNHNNNVSPLNTDERDHAQSRLSGMDDNIPAFNLAAAFENVSMDENTENDITSASNSPRSLIKNMTKQEIKKKIDKKQRTDNKQTSLHGHGTKLRRVRRSWVKITLSLLVVVTVLVVSGWTAYTNNSNGFNFDPSPTNSLMIDSDQASTFPFVSASQDSIEYQNATQLSTGTEVSSINVDDLAAALDRLDSSDVSSPLSGESTSYWMSEWNILS